MPPKRILSFSIFMEWIYRKQKKDERKRGLNDQIKKDIRSKKQTFLEVANPSSELEQKDI